MLLTITVSAQRITSVDIYQNYTPKSKHVIALLDKMTNKPSPNSITLGMAESIIYLEMKRLSKKLVTNAEEKARLNVIHALKAKGYWMPITKS